MENVQEKQKVNIINVDQSLWHLRTVDSLMHKRAAQALEHSPPLQIPKAKPSNYYFATLVRSIVSQQISTKAAAAIFQRLNTSISIDPKSISACSYGDLCAHGLTKQKAKYTLHLAKNWKNLKTEEFIFLPDEEIVDRLVAQYGVGLWTAQMFLLFAMARSDVFAVGDLGLRQQVANWYEIDPNDINSITLITENWAPHRSLASLTLWFYIDNGPVLL